MPTIPYIKRVSAAALGNINSILNSWLPNGKREGSEYLTLNPKRADSAPGSFSINLKTGKWSDFATGDRGLDLVALVSYLENETQGKAARRLAAFLGLESEESSPPKRTGSDSKPSGNGKHQPAGKNQAALIIRAVMMTAGSALCRFPMMHQSHRRRTPGMGGHRRFMNTVRPMES